MVAPAAVDIPAAVWWWIPAGLDANGRKVLLVLGMDLILIRSGVFWHRRSYCFWWQWNGNCWGERRLLGRPVVSSRGKSFGGLGRWISASAIGGGVSFFDFSLNIILRT